MYKSDDKSRKKAELIIYTPGSPILQPLQMFKVMFADLRSSFQLAYRLTIRDFAASYRQSALGYLWAVIPPLVTSLTFILLNKANILRADNTAIPYPVFVITGTVFWQLFVDALNSPLKVVNLNRTMLSKINFPKEALILSGFGQVIVNFVVRFILLCCVLIFFDVQLRWTIIMLFVPVIGLVIAGTVVGVFLVPIGMLYQDIQQLLTICTSALIFFTPVLYPIPVGGALGKIIAYNPISPFIILCREMFYSADLTSIYGSLAVLTGSIVLLFFVWILYRLAMPVLIERMEA